MVDTNNWSLHSDYRFSYFGETNITILNKCVANTFGTRKVVGYLPLLVNQPFRLQIALKTNDTFEVYLVLNISKYLDQLLIIIYKLYK